MASLVRSFGIKLDEKTRTLYPAEGGSRSQLVAIRCYGDPLSDDQLARLDGFFAPAEDRIIGQWLAELSVISAKREDGDMSETLRLHAYTRRLNSYPADIVWHVLLDRPWKFFPTWAELLELLEPAMEYRRALRQSARDVLPKEPTEVISLPVYDDPPAERGPLPFVPEPSAPVPNVVHLREELKELKADKELAASDHGQAYAQSLIQRIAQLEGPKAVTATQVAS